MSSMSLLKELADEMSALNERYSREVVAYCDQLEKRQPPPTEDGLYWGLSTYLRRNGLNGPIVEQVAGAQWTALSLLDGRWTDCLWPKAVDNILVFVPRVSQSARPEVPCMATLRRLAGVG